MFDGIQGKLDRTLKVLRGQAKIRESHIEEALSEIRKSLLEADVHLHVVRRFLDNVKEKALGEKVLGSLTPYQQFIHLLGEEMKAVFGETPEFNLSFKPPVIIFMVGLQGSGKTTSSSKLALYAKRKLKRKPVLVSVDVTRPAAIEQLERMASDAKVDYVNPSTMDPFDRAAQAIKYAQTYGLDMVIVDTAGRLSVDESMMDELSRLKDKFQPQHVLYVADAMSGQQGLQVAEGFRDRVGLTGAVLSKADADTRGGVAFSIREALGVPLQFAGTGEKVESFEVFHPDRMVGRILGMGDLQTLSEKVEEAALTQKKKEKPENLAKRMMKGKMTLTDFQDQMKMMSKVGSFGSILGMMPGMGQMANQINSEEVESKLKKVDAMICSMTPGEREKPEVLNGSRKKRISRGSGTQVEEINQFLREFDQMKRMMKQLKGNKMLSKMMGRMA